MSYIRVNFNRSYVDTEKRKREKAFIFVISLFFISTGSLNMLNFNRRISGERHQIKSLAEIHSDIEKEYRKLSGRAAALKADSIQNKVYMEEMTDVLKLAEYISPYSTTEKLIMLEEGAASIGLYFDEVSIRGDELSIYIQNPRLDIDKLLDSFQINFKRIVINEYSTDRLNLRLGDINGI